MATKTTIPKISQTITQQKVNGTLASPHTYPRAGLGYGKDAGAMSAAKGDGPHTTNRMSAQGANFKMPKVVDPVQIGSSNSSFHVKSADDIKGIGMLNKIKEIGLEKFAGDEQLAEEFVKGFIKEAFTPAEFSKDLMSGAAKSIGTGLAGVVMGLGVTSVTKQIQNVGNGRLHTDFLAALQKAMSSNPVLRQAKKEKVMQYAETVFKFAPHVSTDSNLLSSVLANAIHGEGIDPLTIRTLVDLEHRYTDNSSSSTFSPKSYV